jgi:hypothetical protein
MFSYLLCYLSLNVVYSRINANKFVNIYIVLNINKQLHILTSTFNREKRFPVKVRVSLRYVYSGNRLWYAEVRAWVGSV